jgi:RNA polymerase sigma factor (sigma-70 family)|tara:strand:+ start:2386 stop:2970 length:585 start_codon:yes stop_codon:yes gene_type:complete
MMFFNQKSRIELTNAELSESLGKRHDLEDLGELYNRYIHLVYGVCLKYFKNKDDAQDGVMEIFEKLIGDVNRFEINNFSSWLYVYAKNFCMMKIRASKANFSIKEVGELNSIMENALISHHDEKETTLEDDLQALEKCIETLVKEQKECVSLFYLKSSSYRQIVETTSYELKKVKSHIQNGKRNLKICLESNSE